MAEFKWDKWQKEVLDHKGNITLRSGRQVGKSEVISEKAYKFALENPGTTTLIIAASQRQSSLLFEKVRARIDIHCEKEGNIYTDKPTLTRVILKNGSKIYSLPAGRTGYFIRGFTIDLLIADEAAYIPETVWLAVTPMIAVSRKLRGMGYIILLSTPFGKGGYFYDSFTDNAFKSFHQSSEDCKRIPKDFLKKEKRRMTKEQYAQEYLGNFVDEWHQFYKSGLIKACMTFIEWSKEHDYRKEADYYLGVDLAGYGGDENAFIIVEMLGKKLKVIKKITTERESATNTIGQIVQLDGEFKFKRIFVDDGGLGSPITDLLKERIGKRKVFGLNNATKSIEIQDTEKRQKILKEDLHSNLLMLMETNKIEIISDLDIVRSMKSVTFEYKESGRVRIYGPYTHITEAMVRAAWCIKEKGLDVYCY